MARAARGRMPAPVAVTARGGAVTAAAAAAVKAAVKAQEEAQAALDKLEADHRANMAKVHEALAKFPEEGVSDPTLQPRASEEDLFTAEYFQKALLGQKDVFLNSIQNVEEREAAQKLLGAFSRTVVEATTERALQPAYSLTPETVAPGQTATNLNVPGQAVSSAVGIAVPL